MSNWVRACGVDDVDAEDVIPVVLDGHRLAVYRSPDDRFYATDGVCTHEDALLSDGFVIGHVIECPKHNGRFDYTTGHGKGAPICENLRTYPVDVVDGAVHIRIG